jgi:hypothetical protein
MHRIEAIALLSLLLAGAAALALPPSLQSRMTQLPASLQHELRFHDAAWIALNPAQQQALRRRVAAWDALPDAAHRQQRERWQAWTALPASERAEVQTAAGRFAALPIEQQQALQAQFAQLDATARHGWLLGPALGADYAVLEPLLLQVPPEQREPLLAVLRAMTPVERADLGVLARRTAPAQRDDLRRALLSTSSANRAAWLQSELAR